MCTYMYNINNHMQHACMMCHHSIYVNVWPRLHERGAGVGRPGCVHRGPRHQPFGNPGIAPQLPCGRGDASEDQAFKCCNLFVCWASMQLRGMRSFIVAASVSSALAVDSNPMSKVFELMDELGAKVTADGEKAAKTYKECFEWCDDSAKNAQFAIKTATVEKKT